MPSDHPHSVPLCVLARGCLSVCIAKSRWPATFSASLPLTAHQPPPVRRMSSGGGVGSPDGGLVGVGGRSRTRSLSLLLLSDDGIALRRAARRGRVSRSTSAVLIAGFLVLREDGVRDWGRGGSDLPPDVLQLLVSCATLTVLSAAAEEHADGEARAESRPTAGERRKAWEARHDELDSAATKRRGAGEWNAC